MSDPLPISILLLARDEATRLEVLLPTLSFAREVVVVLDGDGQNDPADIPSLYRTACDPARDSRLRMIAGQRKQRRDSWIKRVSSKIANGVRRWLLKDDTPDTGCGLKLFDRETFLALPYFDHMHRFLPALVLREGYTVRSVEVGHRPRAGGRSKYGTLDRLFVGIVDLLGVLWLRRRASPTDVTEIKEDRGQA